MSGFFAAVWHHLYQDFWPLDASRVGPNIVASVVQFAVVGLVMYAVWPRFRRGVDRWLHGHLSTHFKELHDKLDKNHEEHMRHLQHIIQHSPDIPPLPPPPDDQGGIIPGRSPRTASTAGGMAKPG